MTKEEILEGRRHIFGNALLAALSDTIMNMMDEWAGYLISNSSHTTTMLEVPKYILDEYAKAFANWILKEEFYLEDGFWWRGAFSNGVHYTTEEIYVQFIEQQNKSNGK